MRDPKNERYKDTERAPAWLVRASVAYLALPYAIFAFGWLRLPVALALTAAVAAGAALVWKAAASAKPSSAPFPWRSLLAIAALWTLFSGIGGLGVQNLLDYTKHNAIMSDLVTRPWPVIFDEGAGRGATLVYYVGYYLPAALVGKVLGPAAANAAAAVWAVAGVFLSLVWFQRTVRRGGVGPAVFFVIAGGLDLIGYMFIGKGFPVPLAHLEHWSTPLQYSANTTLLYWVPQHALAGWLLTGLLVEEARARRARSNAWFLLALGTLWSPLVTIGLFPFAAYAAWRSPQRRLAGWHDASAAAIVAVMGLFYAASIASVPKGWLFSFYETDWTSTKLALTYVLEFGAFAALAALLRSSFEGHDDERLWLLALGPLFVLPLYRFGLNNDLVMRASIPALFVFWSFVGKELVDGLRCRETSAVFRMLLVVVVLASATAINEIGWGIAGGPDIRAARVRYRGAVLDSQGDPAGPTTVTAMPEQEYVTQYLGDPSSPFFAYLAKR